MKISKGRFLLLTVVAFAYFLYHVKNMVIGNLDTVSYFLSHLPVSKPAPAKMFIQIQKTRKAREFSSSYLAGLSLFMDPSLKAIPFVDVHIPVDAGKDSILLRLYNHETDSSMTLEKKKVLIYFHGGGWIIGSTKDNHAFTRGLAKETGYLVVSVDYRLAPEHVFPTAINDAYAALEWVLEHIGEYGGDREQVIIAGESAGGNLAAAVTSRFLANHVDGSFLPFARKDGSVIGVWLMYPALNATSFSPEAEAVDHINWVLNMDRMETMRRLYEGGNETNWAIRNHYWFSPLNSPASVLSRYPPTLLTLAKYDILTPESLVFAERLQSLGRAVRINMYNSTIHGFVPVHPFLGPKATKEAVELMHQLSTPSMTSSSSSLSLSSLSTSTFSATV